MLAQITPETTAIWAGIGGILTIALTKIGEYIAKYFSYKRLKEDDAAKRELLRRIAESNEEMVVKQTETEGAINLLVTVGKERHDALILALKDNCKHTHKT